MGTCSCFMDNGCSSGCNTAMMSMFGGYVSVRWFRVSGLGFGVQSES